MEPPRILAGNALPIQARYSPSICYSPSIYIHARAREGNVIGIPADLF
jgi:hypothetical protein